MDLTRIKVSNKERFTVVVAFMTTNRFGPTNVDELKFLVLKLASVCRQPSHWSESHNFSFFFCKKEDVNYFKEIPPHIPMIFNIHIGRRLTKKVNHRLEKFLQ
jgi:hypothetical protein